MSLWWPGSSPATWCWRDSIWGTGELLLPLTSTPVVDTTGAGDAFTAALIKGLDQYQDPVRAAHLAVAAAGATIGYRAAGRS